MASADWVAKVWSRLDDLGRELARPVAGDDQAAEHAALAEQRHGEDGAR